jgi:hypothetical protein
VDGEVAVINFDSVAVVEVRPTRPLSSLSKDTMENSVRTDVCVTAQILMFHLVWILKGSSLGKAVMITIMLAFFLLSHAERILFWPT